MQTDMEEGLKRFGKSYVEGCGVEEARIVETLPS